MYYGLIFQSRRFRAACRDYRLRQEFITPYTPEQNGIVDLPTKECIEWEESSPGMKEFRAALFTRIVPTIKDIGLWGPRIQKAYAEMEVLPFAEISLDDLANRDEGAANEFDLAARR